VLANFLEPEPGVFSFGKKPGRTRVVDQKRTAYRASVEFPVLYTVDGRAGTRGASANDLSAGGLRLMGDEDLINGSVVNFRFTLPNDMVRSVQVEKEIEEKTPFGTRKRKIMVPPAPFDAMVIRSKVVIAFLNVKRRKFAHGVQFLEIDDRSREEIQRFIHIWQIRQLRERAARDGD
jgi:c-di-GMP-binding flagellar brake protein YcgR